jgi:hypothetical protein
VKYDFAPSVIFLTIVSASVVFERLRYFMNDGIAMAARMPMIATTIISSTSVNPSSSDVSFSNHSCMGRTLYSRRI